MVESEFIKNNKERIRAMSQWHMYQIIDGEVVEVVRRGDRLIPITDPIVHECIGQLTLELTQGEDNEQETI